MVSLAEHHQIDFLEGAAQLGGLFVFTPNPKPQTKNTHGKHHALLP